MPSTASATKRYYNNWNNLPRQIGLLNHDQGSICTYTKTIGRIRIQFTPLPWSAIPCVAQSPVPHGLLFLVWPKAQYHGLLFLVWLKAHGLLFLVCPKAQYHGLLFLVCMAQSSVPWSALVWFKAQYYTVKITLLQHGVIAVCMVCYCMYLSAKIQTAKCFVKPDSS